MTDVDLNAIRDRIKNAQRRGTPYPTEPAEQLSVDREGGIRLGPADQGGGSEPLSRVQQGTFADARLERDKRIAATKLPRNTIFVDEPNVRGWTYTITTELDDTFELFAYFDGSDYKVRLVKPELEGKLGAHEGHLYSDGRICLSNSPGSGQPSLEEAFSKSVLWALGIGFLLRTGKFPFSVNND